MFLQRTRAGVGGLSMVVKVEGLVEEVKVVGVDIEG